MKARSALASAVTALLACCLIAGCSSSAGPAASGRASTAAPVVATPTPAPGRNGSGTMHVLKPAGGQVAVYVPKRHAGVGIVVLHSFEHGLVQLVHEGWDLAADRHGFVAIYPTRGSDWNAGLCCGAATKSNRDDVTWLLEQIRAMKAKYHLTTLYLAGESNGGMMVERLLTEEPGLTTRFVTWAAAPEWVAVSAFAGTGYLFHGSKDTTVPIRGGEVRIGGLLVHIEPSSRTRQNFPHAHLTFVTVPGFGHGAPPYWPELAWNALESGATTIPAA